MRFTKQITSFALTVALATSLAACDKKPTGQVVAVVNGEEISLAELNDELRGANIPEGADKKAVMRNLLQRVIDRRLLAQAAKEQGIDKDPAFVSAQRRANEQLLVEMYAKKAAEGVKVPDQAAIDKFIAANPAMFTQRENLKLEQIAFEMPGNPAVLNQFRDDHSLEAVAATLNRLNIKFQRGAGSLDTGTVPAPLLKQIQALPPGEPFVVPMNGRVIVSVVTGREPITLATEQARPVAVEAIRTQDLAKIGQSRLKEARDKAKIEYQPDYAPTPQKTNTATPAKS